MQCIKISVEEYTEVEKDFYRSNLIKLIEEVTVEDVAS